MTTSLTPEQRAAKVLLGWLRALVAPPAPPRSGIGLVVEETTGVVLPTSSGPRCIPGPALIRSVATGDRSEGSPAPLITASRHSVGFPEHLATVNDLEHQGNQLAEVAARVEELELLLHRWVGRCPGRPISLAGGVLHHLITDTLTALHVDVDVDVEVEV